MKFKRVAITIVICLALFLILFSWNRRTQVLDSATGYTGLEFSSLVLKPGKWAWDQVFGFWDRYVHLVGLREKNDELKAEVDKLRLELGQARERAASVPRLEDLLGFVPPPRWTRQGARVVSHRVGPTGLLETIMVDKGRIQGIVDDTPVLAPQGVVGRVLRAGALTSTVLLLTDLNSRVAVIGQSHRSTGIITGQGADRSLKLQYVNLNSPLEIGEILVTSGLAGMYPKGLPVARVTNIERSDISLFLSVTAEPLVHMAALEEVLMLLPEPAREDQDGGESTAKGAPCDASSDGAADSTAPAKADGPGEG